ncbi:MAG TPA: GAF and ANTAR domain-containing protein [Propionibacteriaceae bacterium]|nr:GAF and ANTAR domain-containing protein [Propionibacteriaceae bacterium]
MPEGSARWSRLMSLVESQPVITDDAGASARLGRVVSAACDALSAVGVGITLMDWDGWRGVVAATSPLVRQLDELQFVYGEGPCLDAFRLGRAVLVDDLLDRVWAGWAGYTPAAEEAGVAAVFAFPLQIGAARLGVLEVYRNPAGALTQDELRDAAIFVDIAVATLLERQESAVDGRAAAGLEESLDYRIYQAQGMLRVQLDIDLVDAMARLRAYAVGSGRRLVDVADAVLAGDLHLGREDL